ncbi:uncharacterized protein involved in outer membrane biogenesis [Roseiarcus fermentans]|uniref:Uncharacterized protein involved in outer membrane biogenesis n=1 Tax=Roseiarcus fermentans TaxID=1473586 RepID=A0A366F0N6_9HYPH|nr:AsmA-like C-terminal region-containing protein [Roseiarcus fermentans]RBP08187.1 uncharacterized protein involved in outer membrane biogenesis [Roseiarcus fermentans]
MRRAAMWAGVFALAAVAAGAARWPVAPARVVESLNEAFGRSPLLTWSAPQAATFSVFPWPSLRLVDARLDNDLGENLVSAPEARVDLSIVALLRGQIAPAGVTLTAPTILLDLDRTPFAGSLDPAGAALAISRFAPLGSVSFTDAVMRVTSRKRQLDTVIKSLQGHVDGLALGAPLSVELSALWRDVPLTASGSLDDPRRATLGKPAALRVSVASSLGEFTFVGALTAGAAPGAAGDLSASSHALPQVARLFGASRLSATGISDIAIAGKVRIAPGDMVFDDARVTSGGQTLQGALRLARGDGRVTVSGSLDAGRLALAPLSGPAAALLAPDGRWSERPLPFSLPRDVDLDLRLSAGALDIYGVSFENVAASALLKDGDLTANIVDATAYGGRWQGDLRLISDAGFRLAMHGKLAGADVKAFGAEFGWPDVSGDANAELAVETAGRSPAELIAGLRGRASISIEDGVVSGVNLEEALRRSQRRPLDLAKDMRSGGTAFERATFNVLIADGVARLVDGALVAQGLRADLRGAVDLGDLSLRLRMDAAQSDPTGASPPGAARLSLDINGPWANPTVQTADQTDGDDPGSATPSP